MSYTRAHCRPCTLGRMHALHACILQAHSGYMLHTVGTCCRHTVGTCCTQWVHTAGTQWVHTAGTQWVHALCIRALCRVECLRVACAWPCALACWSRVAEEGELALCIHFWSPAQARKSGVCVCLWSVRMSLECASVTQGGLPLHHPQSL